MTNELKPIQLIQNPLAVTEAPAGVNILELPLDVLPLILGRIWEAKDVANLNLVSKSIKSLNQESIVAAPRLEILFFITYGTHNLSANHSYRRYIREYSFPGDYPGEEALYIIKSRFPKSPDTVKRGQPQPVTSHMRSFLISQFNSLRRGYQLKALLAICSSSKASQAIAKQFYDELPPAVQTELRWQIWNANGQSSVASDGIDRGLRFGEYIIANEIKSPLVHTAICNYLSKFGVDA